MDSTPLSDPGTLSRHSLRGKITLGYYAVAAIILVASLFFVGELRTLEARVVLGQRATDLFNTALEIRRFERNYFLYHQAADLTENGRYIKQAQAMLTANRADFAAIASEARLTQLHTRLTDYQRQISVLAAADPRQFAAAEPQVRQLGQAVVAIAEEMAGTERHQIQTTLASFRSLLLGVIVSMALLIVVIGRALSQRVVKPLKEMENSVAAISANYRETLLAPSNDREILSIIAAFNHMLKELDLRQKSLMRSERMVTLGTMLSGVAHELNNPLSNISTSCQILLEEVGESDAATQKRYLEQIDQQTERARTIVRSLLDFSRERAFRKEAVLLRPLVAQTVGFVRGEVSAKSVVQLSIPDNLSVPADAQRLQQVFVNLIRNAMEGLGPQGRIDIAAQIVQASEPPAGTALGEGCTTKGAMVEIRVTDNGPGIAPDILPRIFDPFFTTKDVGHGMGLGLFVVYEIVDEHGGCIAVQSTPGQGAQFCIRLPVFNLDTQQGAH
ncbi:HAMP domain-containing sensor histidine kinase [Thiobacillus sp.]|uniref:sensor histidine kinase n=1 Tax=Thiobacillus sp. TaxID=924 RepID=UPI00286D94DC|nr:HAMP domain-containing sensor histidine kinase [Thiobacillus sp.]